MRRHFSEFWHRPHDCAGRHGRRRHGFAGLIGGIMGHGDFGWHSMRAGRKLGAEDLQLLILALLAEKPAHGYEIIKALSDRSGGYYEPSPGMVYPALTYLEEIGHASFESEGTRKLYSITDAGRAHLEENRGVADTLLAQLKWVGERMGAMRGAFSSDGEANEALSTKLRAARARLRATLIELRGAPEDEQRRVAEILDRAADEIRRK
ncbi:MAG TPA: PadR family transcriptional regulator [Casimicrobiaceae bacterium]|nr:PadR family transcriptional regulator [Casimicrobiaceae bacterium]